jgi:hypothetical protein
MVVEECSEVKLMPTGAVESRESVLRDCMSTLQLVAAYALPPAVDRRLLWLSENKEKLTEAEREELLGLVAWAEERTREKLQAQLVLKRLRAQWPDLSPSSS